MRALIFNSGLGSRLGALTEHNPKCLVRLPSGETLLHRQLRLLSRCGICDFVVTTGPFAELVEAECQPFAQRGCRIRFVRNDQYAETNYIHSLWLARDLLQGDEVLMLHGDLVFDASYVTTLLAASAGSWGSVDPTLPVPEKDFSADVSTDGHVLRVGVGIPGANLQAFQAMYRLTPATLRTWLAEVERFEARGETGVYAENAANEVFELMGVGAFSYAGHLLVEVDTPEDLERVGKMAELADYAAQSVYELRAEGTGARLVAGTPIAGTPAQIGPREILESLGASRPLVVADPHFANQLHSLWAGALTNAPRFSGFGPNPTIDQVEAALAAFIAGDCDSLVSIGGGSAMDVAKCVRLWSALPNTPAAEQLHGTPSYSQSPHVAIPTTAGTGAESTHFAVVYEGGVKQSVSHPLAQPDVALLVPSFLAGLPTYQRASTMMDAICQALESHWSRASSDESRRYSSEAIALARECWQAYLEGNTNAAQVMMRAANLAGKAINLTTTTAPHAMSYKLTSLYGIAHGHAVALCMAPCWQLLLERADERTCKLLRELDELTTGNATCVDGDGLRWFEDVLASTGLDRHVVGTRDDVDTLCASVNAQRLGNFPLELSNDDLKHMYQRIVCR